jgi:hypothetical protein
MTRSFESTFWQVWTPKRPSGFLCNYLAEIHSHSQSSELLHLWPQVQFLQLLRATRALLAHFLHFMQGNLRSCPDVPIFLVLPAATWNCHKDPAASPTRCCPLTPHGAAQPPCAEWLSRQSGLRFRPSLGINAHLRISWDLLEDPFSLRSRRLQFPSTWTTANQWKSSRLWCRSRICSHSSECQNKCNWCSRCSSRKQ